MDQQLDQYQKSLEKAWERLKSSLLKGIPVKYQVVMAVVLIFAVAANVPNLYYQIRFLITLEQFGFEEGMPSIEGLGIVAYALFQIAIPVLALIGAVQMLFSKTRGWVLVAAFFLLGVLWHLAWVIGDLTTQGAVVNAPLTEVLDEMQYPRIGLMVFWIIVYVICYGFLMSKPIKEFYRVTRKQVRWSIGIVVSVVVIEVVWFLIAWSYE